MINVGTYFIGLTDEIWTKDADRRILPTPRTEHNLKCRQYYSLEQRMKRDQQITPMDQLLLIPHTECPMDIRSLHDTCAIECDLYGIHGSIHRRCVPGTEYQLSNLHGINFSQARCMKTYFLLDTISGESGGFELNANRHIPHLRDRLTNHHLWAWPIRYFSNNIDARQIWSVRGVFDIVFKHLTSTCVNNDVSIKFTFYVKIDALEDYTNVRYRMWLHLQRDRKLIRKELIHLTVHSDDSIVIYILVLNQHSADPVSSSTH